MNQLTKLSGLWVLLWVLLDSQSVSGTCSDCNCTTVPTINATLASRMAYSPFYQPLTTTLPGYKPTDCICHTYFPLDDKSWLEFITTTYCDGTYLVQKMFSSDTSRSGLVRLQGFGTNSTESSFVGNEYIFGAACTNCTDTAVFAVYSCRLYSDCTLTKLTSDYLYALSSQPNVPPGCLDQAQAMIDQQTGLKKGNIERPPHNQHRKCVTRFNGAPCVNEDRVPVGDRLSYPPSQTNCTY